MLSAILIAIASYSTDIVRSPGALQGLLLLLVAIPTHCHTVFRMFRGISMIILLIGGLGLDVYVWHQYRINYVFIFGLNPRSAACGLQSR